MTIMREIPFSLVQFPLYEYMKVYSFSFYAHFLTILNLTCPVLCCPILCGVVWYPILYCTAVAELFNNIVWKLRTLPIMCNHTLFPGLSVVLWTMYLRPHSTFSLSPKWLSLSHYRQSFLSIKGGKRPVPFKLLCAAHYLADSQLL
jgi:hypothetical protein